MTHRHANLNQKVADGANFTLAFDGYSRGKHHRDKVSRFEANLDYNLKQLLSDYIDGSWQVSDYEERIINDRKRRRVAILPPKDHVVEWAICNVTEHIFTDTYIRESCSCVDGRGTHDFLRLLKAALDDTEGTKFYAHLDCHHYFELIDTTILKERIRAKIKDPSLLRQLDKVIDSYGHGLPLGTKLSQTLANFYLAAFDHEAQSIFHVDRDPEAMAYWRNRYVSDSLVTCTPQTARELARGVAYMNRKFDRLVSQGVVYLRFADDILFLHSDKTFLRLVVEMAVVRLTRDYHCQLNGGLNVRPVDIDGIDICGYVFFHDHVALRKRNKQALCRQVAKCKRKGLTPEQTRLVCASRIGFAIHADSRNLLKNLPINMEKRLGKVIRGHKSSIPFQGMRYDQKQDFSDIVCPIGGDEEQYKIELRDYAVQDSIVNKGQQCLALRYARIMETVTDGDNERYIYETDSDGKVVEHYSYTGSSVMIDQAQNDFTHSDLPCPTVVQEMLNKFKKRFYKFT